MSKVLFLFISLTLLAACSSTTPKQEKYSDESNPSKSQKPNYNVDEPITYAEYRKWREANDSAAQKYSKYKAWEIQYRRWKKQQIQ